MKFLNAFFLSYTLLIASNIFGQKNKKNTELENVQSAQKNFANILTTQNWKALPAVLGDSLTYIHSFGRVDSKVDFIKNIARFAAIPRWEYTDVKVQLFSNFAIFTNNLFVTLKMLDGTAQISQQRSTEVWKKEKQGWILISHQSTSYK